MFKWQTALGVMIGLASAAVILAIVKGGDNRQATRSGAILSECDGQLKSLVIQYESGAAEVSAPVYRSFLRQLDADVTVYAVCPDKASFEQLVAEVGPVKCKLAEVNVAHPITTWSRDRWVALAPADGGPATILSPGGEVNADIWQARAGDSRVGENLAVPLRPGVVAARSDLYFDGGDILADDKMVFVMPRVLQRNIQKTATDRRELINKFQVALGRPVTMLADAPDHHAGMFMMAAGNRTMLVADPSLAKGLIGTDPRQPPAEDTDGSVGGAHFEPAGGNADNYSSGPDRSEPASLPTDGMYMELPGGPDFSASMQLRLDGVARQCKAAGYKVVRIPMVPARDGRTFLTYVNVIIDVPKAKGAKPIVYMPTYKGAEPLNQAAGKVWEQLGYEVRPVDCTSTYRHFGNLHCLVNVLARD